MKKEITIRNAIATLGYPVYWISKNFNEPSSTLPFIVLGYISDAQLLYMDGLDHVIKARLTCTIYGSDEVSVLNIKESLRQLLLHDASLKDFNFNFNTGLTDYSEAMTAYIYQLDLDFVYVGTE